MKEIGRTPLLRLFEGEYTLFAKEERSNPTGSIKDRVAFAVIEDAEKKGLLKTGGAVIEATSGNTGIGLAYVASQKGYRAIIVMPDTMSVERQELIKSYGGEVVLTEGSKGMQGAVEYANQLLKQIPNSILADQFNNPVCWKVHYERTGPEVWEQTQGQVDVFVACVGTGGTLTGVGKFLKEKNPNIKVVAVEPEASPLLSKGRAGTHRIQGIGANFVPKVLDRGVYDEVLTVSDAEAMEMARRLYKEGKSFVGISSGAAVAVAMRVGNCPENKGKNIVTILPDDGGRYLSTGIFED